MRINASEELLNVI